MSFIKVDLDGAVATLTIARPEKLNALDPDVVAQLGTALDGLAARTEVRCLIVTGEGKAFVAGADIARMQSMSADDAITFARLGQSTFAKLESLPFPAIAAVNGFALGGGCELLLACDFGYASDKAKFGQPEVKLGVIPGFGGTQRMLRRLGASKARELIYTGETIGADEALRIGLVAAVFPHDELLSRTRERATLIAQQGPLAVRAAKRVILDGESVSLSAGLALEARAFADGFATADQREGMGAFLAKRPPAFEGK